jgi:hypothetical protein
MTRDWRPDLFRAMSPAAGYHAVLHLSSLLACFFVRLSAPARRPIGSPAPKPEAGHGSMSRYSSTKWIILPADDRRITQTCAKPWPTARSFWSLAPVRPGRRRWFSSSFSRPGRSPAAVSSPEVNRPGLHPDDRITGGPVCRLVGSQRPFATGAPPGSREARACRQPTTREAPWTT